MRSEFRCWRPMNFGRFKVGKLPIFLKLRKPLMPSSRLRETLVQAQSKGLEKEALEEQLKKQVRVITA